MYCFYSDMAALQESVSVFFTDSSNADYQGCNVVHKENIEMMEYPFLTLSTYPEDFVLHIGIVTLLQISNFTC